MQRPQKTGGLIVLAAAIVAVTLPSAGGAEAARGGCVAPNVVGVSLASARQALGGSGCAVKVHQLPAHGRFVTPSSPDGRQLVARQSPPAGAHAQAVNVWLKPLCAPSVPSSTPGQRGGPTELIAGLYLSGGPVRTSPHCQAARSEAGTVTVTSASGTVIAHRSVRDGRLAIFPLAPGSYELSGSLAHGSARFPHATFTISARRTTRVNLVASIR